MSDFDAYTCFLCLGWVFGFLTGLHAGGWIKERVIAKVWGDDWRHRIKDE